MGGTSTLGNRGPSAIEWTESDGASIAYTVFGDGPVDLAIIPGFVSHLEVLPSHPAVARFLARLGSFARVIVWDKREQGLSDRLGRPPTIEQSAADLAAVLDAAGSRRATLFGISEGGPTALLFAATNPHRVDGLALYGTWARITEAPGYPQGFPPELVTRMADRVREGWGGPLLLHRFAPSMSGDRALADWWARLCRLGSSPKAAADLLRMYETLDVRDVLPSISAPTLVLHRTGDQLTTLAQGRYVADHVPGARFVELPGSDHLFCTGDTEALLSELEEFVTGERRAPAPDRVLATVLFTDIVGSTERAAAMGDSRWRDLLALHDQAVRRELAHSGGRLIKTSGDGVLATFEGPARAIGCARALNRAMEGLDLTIRAGVHTGECEVIGDDIGGIAVHIAARIAASAGGGEVLVSRTVTDLVAGSGLGFHDRGEHELKGVPGRWQIYAVNGSR